MLLRSRLSVFVQVDRVQVITHRIVQVDACVLVPQQLWYFRLYCP
jgi:hypothetical protein